MTLSQRVGRLYTPMLSQLNGSKCDYGVPQSTDCHRLLTVAYYYNNDIGAAPYQVIRVGLICGVRVSSGIHSTRVHWTELPIARRLWWRFLTNSLPVSRRRGRDATRGGREKCVSRARVRGSRVARAFDLPRELRLFTVAEVSVYAET